MRQVTGHDTPWVPDYTPMGECVHGHVYRLRCRNLTLGAWDSAKREFIGIRTKFDRRFLDAEEHWDCGPPHGTACPVEDLGALPDGIGPENFFGDQCRKTGRPTEWDPDQKNHVYKDTREPIPAYPESCAVIVQNQPLFDYLKSLGA